MTKRIVLVLLALLSIGVQAFSQSAIRGKVTDSKGEAIPGASVVVKGTSTGSMTDLDGNYRVNASSSATLVFSCIGYASQEVKVGSQSVIDIVLAEDSQLLEDVVVVAYGTAKRKDLTGSIGTVDSKAIVSQAQGSVTRALEGTVPGLQTAAVDGQPGLDMGIRIRGIGTANAANSNALIIIDGSPALEGTNVLSSLNNSDIESITVLKDAASTALYGARGANGVVLVTTKTGKQGKMKISLQARFGINTVGANSKFTKVGDKGADELYEYYWNAIYNDVYYGYGANTGSLQGNATAAAQFASAHLFDYNGNATSFERNGLGNRMAYRVPGATYKLTGTLGTTSQSATMEGAYLVNPDGRINPNAEYLWNGKGGSTEDALLQARFRQEYTVSASGASDKIDYHVSLGMLSDPSYISWSSFDRYTARANVNAQVTDWLKAGANFAYTHRLTKSQATRWGRNPGYVTQNVFTWVDTATCLDQMYARNANGDFILNADGDKMVNLNYGRNYPNVANSYSPMGYTATQWSYNLPALFDQSEYSQNYDDMTMKGYVRVNFLKYFSAEANLSYDKTFETLIRFYNTETAHSMNGLADDYKSAIHRTKKNYGSLNTQQLINYNQDINKHHVDALLGHEYYQYDYDHMVGGGAHTLINDFQGYVNFLGTATYSTFGGTVGGSINKLTMESYFARANYIYDDKYYVSGSIRRDGSSKFKKSENRWGTFWSVGAGWRISSEPWMQGASSWLNNLKIRASYGVIGNQNGIGYYSGYQTWSYSAASWTGSGTSTYPSATKLSKNNWVNDSLTWENVRTTDAGFDFTLFGGKLSGTFDWFNKHTVNAIWNKNVSFLAAGQATMDQNTAGIRSTGIEFELTYQPVKTQDWDVILSLNGTHYKTTLTSLPEGDDYTYTAGSDGWSTTGTGSITAVEYLRGVGKDYFNLYLFKYGGVAGNTGKTYWATDGKQYTGNAAGNADLGRALYYHKVTAEEAGAGKYGNMAAGTEILTTDYKVVGDGDRYEMGTATPDLYGGFNVNARWKNLDLSVMLSYQIGGKFISVDYGSTEAGKYMAGVNLNGNGNAAISRELLGNTWTPENPDAKFPMLRYTSSSSADWGANLGSWNYTDLSMFDASYLAIKNITLGYTFPKKWMNKAKISNLRIYATCDNPCLIYSHSGVDPRWSMTGGMEVGAYSYPYLSVYTFGINLDF